MVETQHVSIYTDGACKGNPGPGGWAAIVERDGVLYAHSGREPRTTNNRMELIAAIKGLEAIGASKEVVIYSDSTYLVNTMTRGWKRRANHDLWEQLDRLARDYQITWEWVPSHSGIPGNEMADRFASMEARLSQREHAPSSRKP